MNFGLQLLSSPTHSTLELLAEDGASVRASSVILSFNSPVIDHMTTSLHLDTLNMSEFCEGAVRYFVDAAYTGDTPLLPRHLFRDVYKMARVYEVSWLVTRCVDHFAGITDTIRLPSFTDLLYIFEEAAFAVSQLKSRQLVQIVFNKISSLNWKRQFIKQYLHNLSALAKHQLDLIIELAGSDVHLIVQPLLHQLTEQLALEGQEHDAASPVRDTRTKDAGIQTKVTGAQLDELGTKVKEAAKGSNDTEPKGTGARPRDAKVQPNANRTGTLPRQTRKNSKDVNQISKEVNSKPKEPGVRPKKVVTNSQKEVPIPTKNTTVDPLEAAVEAKAEKDEKTLPAERELKKTGSQEVRSKEQGIQPNCRYFLQNCDLSLCQKYHTELFDNLFDVLQSTAAGSQTDLVWLFQVLRKSSKQAVKTPRDEVEFDGFAALPPMFADSRPSLTSALSIEQSEDLRSRDVVTSLQRVIPNLFNTLNFDQTFEELVDWLGTSQQVTNLLMFMEGLWTWLAVNKDKKVKCSPQIMEKIRSIKKERSWRTVFSIYVNFRHNTIYSEQFFDGLKSYNDICGEAERGLEFAVMVEKTRYVTLRSLFLEAGKLTFHYDNLAIAKCGKPGKCGFMLTVVTSEDGYVSLQLCTDPGDYSKTMVHFHEDIRAENMHFIARDKAQTYSFPLSWLGRPRVVDNTVFWGSCRRLLNWADELLFDVLLST